MAANHQQMPQSTRMSGKRQVFTSFMSSPCSRSLMPNLPLYHQQRQWQRQRQWQQWHWHWHRHWQQQQKQQQQQHHHQHTLRDLQNNRLQQENHNSWQHVHRPSSSTSSLFPPASHKWTWGVDITENDVLASNQKAKGKGKKAHHSGYAQSLPDGVFRKGYSVTASIATAVSADFSRPPTVTGMDAGLYFSDTESVHSSCADDQSNAGSNAKPAPPPTP